MYPKFRSIINNPPYFKEEPTPEPFIEKHVASFMQKGRGERERRERERERERGERERRERERKKKESVEGHTSSLDNQH